MTASCDQPPPGSNTAQPLAQHCAPNPITARLKPQAGLLTPNRTQAARLHLADALGL
jgi:hypothetical protein